MQIIDAHHHFWNIEQNYLPWLRDEPPIPFRYGDYSSLKRNYLIEDYRRDAGRFDVIGSVYIETEWDPADPVGETRWVKEIRPQGLPSVMVAQAWLDRDDAEAVLHAHGQTPFVRGIRHKPRAARSPDLVEPDLPGSMGDSAFRKGFALLKPNGLSFDLQTPWWHFEEARALADAFGDTQIIVNHTGLPSDRSASGLAGWRKALKLLAGAPNVAIKISGIGLVGRPWTVADNQPIVLDAIEIFGTDRAMFASNFPVDGLVASFETIFDGFAQITAQFADADRALLFRENARRIYRLEGKTV
ncbi:amidohydrolase [Devosia sp.]|uniref:amidohydrolase family protein n=1 Tax=Devosia sp. TaxID=1871048 RepID=UPI0025FAF8D9|nr:amidohydrolase family protein [Devosia sp.]MCR6636473.1 amidohydrolase family protein [Devosia sp.]